MYVCTSKLQYVYVRSRLDRSVELHANTFWEDDIDNTQVNESEVMYIGEYSVYIVCPTQASYSLCLHNTHLSMAALITICLGHPTRTLLLRLYCSSTLLSNLLLIQCIYTYKIL